MQLYNHYNSYTNMRRRFNLSPTKVVRWFELTRDSRSDIPYRIEFCTSYSIGRRDLGTHIHMYSITFDEYIYLRRLVRKPDFTHRRGKLLMEKFLRKGRNDAQ